eukprot:SAG31_NODE_22538_length_523_cov_1.084906_1_plen_96_part_00
MLLARMPSISTEDTVAHASASGDVDTLRRVLLGADATIDVNEPIDSYGCTALHRACAESQTKAVRWLLEHAGAQAEICDAFGKRPVRFHWQSTFL